MLPFLFVISMGVFLVTITLKQEYQEKRFKTLEEDCSKLKENQKKLGSVFPLLKDSFDSDDFSQSMREISNLRKYKRYLAEMRASHFNEESLKVLEAQVIAQEKECLESLIAEQTISNEEKQSV